MGDLESLAQLRDIVLEERWFAKLYLGSFFFPCFSVGQPTNIFLPRVRSGRAMMN